MKLTLNHLAPYLPYGLKCNCMGLAVDDYDDSLGAKIVEIVGLNSFVEIQEDDRNITEEYGYDEVFPLLKPMSILTRKELVEEGFCTHIDFILDGRDFIIEAPYNMLDFLFSKHYDVFGLINQRLAVSL